MEILIQKGYGGVGVAKDYYEELNKLDGKWIEVETSFIFKDQFNTVPLREGHNGLRVHLRNIKEIKNDFRIGRFLCRWCHANSPLGMYCHKCGFRLETLDDKFNRKEILCNDDVNYRFRIYDKKNNLYWNKQVGWVRLLINASTYSYQSIMLDMTTYAFRGNQNHDIHVIRIPKKEK